MAYLGHMEGYVGLWCAYTTLLFPRFHYSLVVLEAQMHPSAKCTQTTSFDAVGR